MTTANTSQLSRETLYAATGRALVAGFVREVLRTGSSSGVTTARAAGLVREVLRNSLAAASNRVMVVML